MPKKVQKETVKEKCSYCGGKRKVECDCTGGCGRNAADDDCPACHGTGMHFCPSCDGTGYQKDY